MQEKPMFALIIPIGTGIVKVVIVLNVIAEDNETLNLIHFWLLHANLNDAQYHL